MTVANRITEALRAVRSSESPIDGEVWLPVDGAPHHAISNMGRVLTLSHFDRRTFEPYLHANFGSVTHAPPRFMAAWSQGGKGTEVRRVVMHHFDRPARAGDRVVDLGGPPLRGRTCYLDNHEWAAEWAIGRALAMLDMVLGGATSTAASRSLGVPLTCWYAYLRTIEEQIGPREITHRKLPPEWGERARIYAMGVRAAMAERRALKVAAGVPWPEDC